MRLIILHTASLIALALCDMPVHAQRTYHEMGRVRDSDISEASGLAASRSDPMSLWIHNDSGDKPRLFRIFTDGRVIEEVRIASANNVDWEDMCSFSLDGQNWLLVADVGDNAKRRGVSSEECCLYLIPEPSAPQPNRANTRSGNKDDLPKRDIAATRRIRFRFAGGPADCEAVAVDTEHREVMLITKSLSGLQCELHSLSLDEPDNEIHTTRLVASLGLPAVTGVDISAGNTQMVILTPFHAIVAERKPGANWKDSFGVRPGVIRLPPMKQAESICYSADGGSLYTISEGKDQMLFRITPDQRVDER